MFQAVFIGDLHLDGMGFIPNGNEAVMAEVAKAEAYAVRKGIEHVIYLGDIGNKPVLSYEAHELLLDQFNKHKGVLTRHIILGNHDFSHTGRHSLTVLQKALAGTDVHIYTQPTRVEIGGVPVNFLPYPYPNEELPDEIDLRNSLNISHFEVSGSVRDNGTASSSKHEVPSSSHWIMGHLHTPHDVGRVHYVGTLFQRNFGESLPKSFSVVKAKLVDDVLKVKKTRVEHAPNFTLQNLIIESEADLDSIPSGENEYCKLFVASSVNLPLNLLLSRPNVLRAQVYKTKTERAALVADSVIHEVATMGYNAFEGLNDFLESYYPDLSARDRKRIDQLLTRIKESLP